MVELQQDHGYLEDENERKSRLFEGSGATNCVGTLVDGSKHSFGCIHKCYSGEL